MNNTRNIQNPDVPVKQKVGPFKCLSDAIKVGKQDADAKRIKTLTIIKTNGAYDYVCGAGELFPFDTVIYRYHYIGGIAWSKPYRPDGTRA
jgi:hypothetical protein